MLRVLAYGTAILLCIYFTIYQFLWEFRKRASIVSVQNNSPSKQPSTFRVKTEDGPRGPDDTDGNLVIDTSDTHQVSHTDVFEKSRECKVM